MIKSCGCIFLQLLLLATQKQAEALEVGSYFNENAWSANAPMGTSFFLNLNQYHQDFGTGVPGGVDFGPFTVQSTTSDVSGIDAAPYLAAGDFLIDGSTYLILRTEADKNDQVEMRFDEPVLAFGADIGFIASMEAFDIEFTSSSGSTLRIPSDLVSRSFWGFVSSKPIASLRFIGTHPDGTLDYGTNFSLDNIRGVAVPEPAGLVLLAISLPLLVDRRRRPTSHNHV